MVTATMSIVINAVDRASGTIDATKQSALRAQQASARAARTAGIAMTALGAAALLAARGLTKAFTEIEQAFANVTTLMEGADDAMDIFGDTVERLSKTLPVQGGQLEIVNGLYQVLSAGITDTAEAQEVLTVAIKAGIAGVSDTFTAVDLLTTSINAYGLEASDAEHVSDILFTIIKRGKTTMTELGTSFGRVVAIAPALGVNLEEVGAALATLTKVGQNTDEASTALRATFLAFIKPTDNMKDAIEALGFESGQAIVAELGFAGALKAVFGPLEGNVAALGELVPNVRALQAVLPLTGTAAQTFTEDMEAMDNATGAAGVAFGKAADTMAARITIAKNRIDAATLSIGEGATPAMATMTEAMATAAEGMAFLDEKTGGALGAILTFGGAVLAGVGPIVAMIAQLKIMAIAKSLNTLANTSQTASLAVKTGATGVASAATAANTAATGANTGGLLANSFAAVKLGVIKVALAAKTAIVTAAQWLWNIAMSANPIGLIVLAIGLLIGAIVFLVTHWDQVRGAMEAVWKFIKPVLIPVIEALKFVADALWQGLQAFAGWFLSILAPVFQLWAAVAGVLTDAWSGFMNWLVGVLFPIFQVFMDVAGFLTQAWEGVVDFFQGIWDGIVQGIAAFGSIILDLGGQFLTWIVDGFTGIFGQMWDLGIQIMTAILNGIWDAIAGAGQFFADIGDAIVGFFTGSPSLTPRLQRLFGGVGEEMGLEMGRGLVRSLDEAKALAIEAGADIAASLAQTIETAAPTATVAIAAIAAAPAPVVSEIAEAIEGLVAPQPAPPGLDVVEALAAFRASERALAREPTPIPEVTVSIGTIVASGVEEGRLAAEGLMDELRRRGIRLGIT